MRRRVRIGMALAMGLALGACAGQPTTPLPNPAQTAMHEWDHGPPWGPEELPWVSPPQVLAYAPGSWGPGYWGPGPWWGPSVGIGLGFGRGHWWRGHRGWHGGHGAWRGGFHGGWRGGGGHVRGGGRGRH
ncbi:hypothetical protein [Roseicella aquatilis]|uniref:Lipoprotein n=1 Tax=Roseicella aquatilis TaxID=2527868 RepID=A0A4R4D948_9PROT|nr:hypothetical protein [Roseicella aquatilis]TCZ56615.1 hypothetical protein EXY23_19690 [Roseicella aquatilis]